MNRVIAIGNPYRGDDGIGRAVLSSLNLPGWEKRILSGEGLDLMPAWENAKKVAVIDAAKGLGAPGSMHLFDASEKCLPASFERTSSHAMGLCEAIELARTLGLLPEKLLVFAIEGETFEPSENISQTLEERLPEMVRWVSETLGERHA